jgi:hypothetical protein
VGAPHGAAGAWHHLAATWDGKTNRLFVNGSPAAYTDAQTATGWGVGHEVGRSWTQPDYYWDGLIADLRVYDRALAEAEVKEIGKSAPRVPAAAPAGPAGDPKVSAAVDRILLAKLREHKREPAPAADDAAFHRRAMLDLGGRVPARVETEVFLADRSPDKRLRLLDDLLAGRELPIYWSQVLSGWLMPAEGRRDPQFVAYLRNGLAKNKPWDRLARQMLLAPPGSPAASFLSYRRAALKDLSIARDVGQAFFGVNLHCAQCHDHPTVKEWTRERFFGLSAFFARTYEYQAVGAQNRQVLAFGEKPAGELEYLAEGKKKVAPPRFLDGTAGTELPAGAGRREALARIAFDARSPYFKRALANRVWRKLMGRGLVEPVDMMHDGNPATHPELLALLADDFAGHRFDLRRLIAVVVQSQAYARSSRWTGEGAAPDERLYATALLKPLDADQLAVSLPLATGYYDPQLEGKSKRTMAQLRPAAAWKEVLAEFDAPGDEFEPTAGQALFLLNSPYVQTHFLAKSNLTQALSALADDAALARRAYLSVLARPPSPEEAARVSDYLRRRGARARAEACRELVWALFSGPEFRFNH